MSEQGQTTDANAVREAVAASYGKRISRPRGSGCCASSGSCSPIAETIGYGKEDVGGLPAGADVPTFGCGNPLAFSKVAGGDTVVDLGSGAGFDLLIAAGKVGTSGRVIGFDMTDEMIEKARANVAAAGHTNVEVRKGLIEDLPIESGTVDWVISNCVINLSPEKDRVFAEIARVLKPGGRMLVSDIVVEDLPQWVRESMVAVAACVGGAIGEGQYIQGLRDAGLVDVEVRARHVYSAEEILPLLESVDPAWAEEIQEAVAGSGCCGEVSCCDGSAVAELAGKGASIQVFARKPVTAV